MKAKQRFLRTLHLYEELVLGLCKRTYLDQSLIHLPVGLGPGDGSASEGEPGHPIVIAEQQTQPMMRR
jgi:hypothetical protein